MVAEQFLGFCSILVQLLKSTDLGRHSLLYLKEIGHGWFGKVSTPQGGGNCYSWGCPGEGLLLTPPRLDQASETLFFGADPQTVRKAGGLAGGLGLSA